MTDTPEEPKKTPPPPDEPGEGAARPEEQALETSSQEQAPEASPLTGSGSLQTEEPAAPPVGPEEAPAVSQEPTPEATPLNEPDPAQSGASTSSADEIAEEPAAPMESTPEAPPLPPEPPPPPRTPREPPPERAAPPPPPSPPVLPFDATRRRVPWIPIVVVAAIAAALVLGFFAFQSFTGDALDESAYIVEPYAPTTELITARDRVEARAEPDTSSRIVVIFGDGVTLNVSGRVSRGIGNDWYAISWNNQTAFVRTQDVVPGSGAPPAPIVRERPPPEEEEEEEEPELTDEEQNVVEPPRPSGALGVGDVNWVREPSARDFARFFPDRALDDGQSGNVTLSCIVGGSGRLACSVASESPAGYGFGRAAIDISRQLRVRTTLPDGSSAEGRELRLPLSFRAG